MHDGGAKQVGSKCFKFSTGNERDSRFGIWQACPQTASVAVAPRQLRRQRSSRWRLPPSAWGVHFAIGSCAGLFEVP